MRKLYETKLDLMGNDLRILEELETEYPDKMLIFKAIDEISELYVSEFDDVVFEVLPQLYENGYFQQAKSKDLLDRARDAWRLYNKDLIYKNINNLVYNIAFDNKIISDDLEIEIDDYSTTFGDLRNLLKED